MAHVLWPCANAEQGFPCSGGTGLHCPKSGSPRGDGLPHKPQNFLGTAAGSLSPVPRCREVASSAPVRLCAIPHLQKPLLQSSELQCGAAGRDGQMKIGVTSSLQNNFCSCSESLQQVPGQAGDPWAAAGLGYVQPARCYLDRDAQSYLHRGARQRNPNLYGDYGEKASARLFSPKKGFFCYKGMFYRKAAREFLVGLHPAELFQLPWFVSTCCCFLTSAGFEVL